MGKSNRKLPAIPKKAREDLNGALDALLNNMQVLNGSIDFSHYQEISGLVEKLRQHEPWKSHIGTFDLFDILSRHARRYGLAECGDKLTKVAAHLDKARFGQFRNDVHSYLLSLPRTFDVIVDLPAMPRWGSGELKLTDGISLIERQSNIQPGRSKITLAMLATMEAENPPVAVKVRSSGFGADRVDTTAVLAAISQMKQFFQMFRRIGPSKYLWGLSNLLRGSNVKCRVVDSDYPDEIMYVQLPEHLRTFLSKISLDEDKLQHYDYSKGILAPDAIRKAETREEKSSALLLSMSWIPKVMDCPVDWPDADRLRSALEWGFDSEENDNQTFAFIQACIGLEALLGDDDKNEPLTTRLADRCAYLLGTSHKDRTYIRGRFKQMYEVRSKVIHGRSPRLNYSDAQELHFAQRVLGDVLTAEANTLLKALDKAKKKAQLIN